jgi:hypothetical protein
MNGQGPGATAVAEEPTPTPAPQAPELETPQHQPEPETTAQPEVTDRQAEILREMDLPEELKEPQTPEQPEGAEPQTPETPEPAPPSAQQPPNAPEPKTAEDEQDKPVPKQWPQSAKARVAEESAKRKEWRKKAESGEEVRGKQAAKIAELSQRLQQQRPVQIAPGTTTGALDDVEDVQQLPQIEKDATELLNFCDRYPQGVDEVLIGRDKEGNEIRRSYTPEQIGELRIYARSRKEAAPKRATFLQERAGYEGIARKLYSDKERTTAGLTPIGRELVFDENGELIMQQMPSLLGFSDGLVNIARYLRGLMLEQQDLQQLAGRAAPTPQVDPKIAPFVRPQGPIAPTPPKARTPAPTPAPVNGAQENAVAVAEAEKNAIEAGGDENSLLNLTDLLLNQNKRGGGGRQPVAV